MKAFSRLDALQKALASTSSHTPPNDSRSEGPTLSRANVDPDQKSIPAEDPSAEAIGEDGKEEASENDETERLSEPQTNALSRKSILTLIFEYVHPNPFIEYLYYDKSRMPAKHRPFSLEARVE
jgi:hypothetical protein